MRTLGLISRYEPEKAEARMHKKMFAKYGGVSKSILGVYESGLKQCVLENERTVLQVVPFLV